MNKYLFIIGVSFITFICHAQDAKVIVFKHDLRWTDESRFPNYFLIPEVKDSIFTNARLDLMDFLKVPEIAFPKDIDYKIYTVFGKQSTELPKGAGLSKPVVGIFSFITRATSGWAMFWKLRIIIKQNNIIIYDKEIIHELEYFNPSGYLTSILWLSPKEFQDIFCRMVKETLGFLPANNDKIILGSIEEIEKKVRDLSPSLKRNLLKINGAWRNGGNFSAKLECEKDTLINFYYRQGFGWEIPQPSFSAALSALFTQSTGIGLLYKQNILNQLNGTVNFSDGNKNAISLRWIETETRTFKDEEAFTSYVSGPVIAELFDQKEQTGYFLFTKREKVNETEKTKDKLNLYSGVNKINTLGVEKIYRIEGVLSGKSILAEYNENSGIILINSGNELLGAMIVQNCNPENQAISETILSENKKFMSSTSQNIVKPSVNNENKMEWYPVYLVENSAVGNIRICLETIICLFISIGI